MPKTTVRKPRKKKTPQYFLEVSVNGTTFKTRAETLEAALTSFVESPEFPLGAKTKTVISFGTEKSKRVRILQPTQARRIFNQIELKPLALEIFARNLTNTVS